MTKNYKYRIWGAFLGIFIFLVSIFLSAQFSHSFQNWYTKNEFFNWHTMAISHFGVSNLAVPFTITTLLTSFLIIYFIQTIKHFYENKGLLKRGTSWIITGYVALTLAFLFMLYKPNSTFSIAAHYLFAAIYFIAIPVGIIMVGFHFNKINRRKLGYASLILGILSFIFGPIICFGSSILLGNKGVAIPELIQIILEDIWIILIGISMFRKK